VTVSPTSLARRFPSYFVFGLAIIALAEGGLFAGIEVVGLYFTPLVWTGYIMVVDAILYVRRGRSYLQGRRRRLLWLLPWSIVCWLIFEGYNLYIQNWSYHGLPQNYAARLLGYVWSFATIFPSVLLTAELWETVIHQKQGRKQRMLTRRLLTVLPVLGATCLIVPLVLDQADAAKLFALVWIGFVFLLDPINSVAGRSSIISDLANGRSARLWALFLAGLTCGLLWEFWNYWATARWTYSVPIDFVGPRVFEMPLLGFVGFLPFSVECFVMNEFFYVLFPRLDVERQHSC